MTREGRLPFFPPRRPGPASPRPALALTLYGKPGCHLCEEARALLGRLQGRYPHHLAEVDIEADAALLARYGERIPVLVVGEREIAAPLALSAAVVERALAAAHAG